MLVGAVVMFAGCVKLFDMLSSWGAGLLWFSSVMVCQPPLGCLAELSVRVIQICCVLLVGDAALPPPCPHIRALVIPTQYVPSFSSSSSSFFLSPVQVNTFSSNTFLGEVDIALDILEPDTAHDQWFKLHPKHYDTVVGVMEQKLRDQFRSEVKRASSLDRVKSADRVRSCWWRG